MIRSPKTALIKFLCKNIQNISITKTKYVKKGLIPIKVKGTFKELESTILSSHNPYEPKEVFDFVDGKINSLTINDSYNKFQLSLT